MTKIELGKTYRTRYGREVKIYAVDGGGNYPVHGAILNEYGWHMAIWPADGKLANDIESGPDLIEVKPRIKREVWVNVYPKHYSDVVYATRETADRAAADYRIACVKLTIDCEEGEGLE